jgi:hypothetical protein
LLLVVQQNAHGQPVLLPFGQHAAERILVVYFDLQNMHDILHIQIGPHLSDAVQFLLIPSSVKFIF